MASPRRRRYRNDWLKVQERNDPWREPAMPKWLGLTNLFPVDDGKEVVRKSGREWHIHCERFGSPTMPEPCCLTPDLNKHGKRISKYQDRRQNDLPTWIVIWKQRFECQTCGATFTEIFDDLDDDRKMTKRFRHAVTMSSIKRTFSDAAVFHQTERTKVFRLFHEYADEKLCNYEPRCPRVLSVDENFILGSERFVCCDPESGKILDLLPTRQLEPLRQYLSALWTGEDVEVFVQDMWKGYETLCNDLFPRATNVIDKFHVVRYANNGFNEARKRYQNVLDKDGKKDLKGSWRVFLKRWDDLDENGQNFVSTVSELHPALGDAYLWKERFYMIYDEPTRRSAEKAYDYWARMMPDDLRPFFKELIRAMKNWQKPVFTYFDQPYTNGLIENLNGRINKINDLAKGMDFRTLRAKAILRYGEVIPVIDFAAFNIRLNDPDYDWYMSAKLGHGFDPRTLIKALKDGTI